MDHEGLLLTLRSMTLAATSTSIWEQEDTLAFSAADISPGCRLQRWDPKLGILFLDVSEIWA